MHTPYRPRIFKLLSMLLLSLFIAAPAFAYEEDEYIHIHKKDPWRAAAFNLIPFGVGSYQQGDPIGGTSIAVIDTASVLVALAPFTYAPELSQGGGWGTLAAFTWALGGLVLGRVVGVAAPWLHFNAYQQAKSAPDNSPATEGQAPISTPLLNYQLTF